MKSLFLAAALVLTAGGPALAQSGGGEDLDFVLVNTSGSDVTAFHVSHADTDQWEENLIAGGVMPDGNEVTVTIADGQTICTYDIMVKFADGSSLEDYGVDLCDLGEYTVTSVED